MLGVLRQNQSDIARQLYFEMELNITIIGCFFIKVFSLNYRKKQPKDIILDIKFVRCRLFHDCEPAAYFET